jgi:photosystem II stability/assembly factor-like uncharacterized protein
MHLWRLIAGIGWAVMALWPSTAFGHDAGAWGGLFRSRDGGSTWFQANVGRVVTGALSVAIDASDPNHVLLGTDSGLLETHNGGRDWLTPPGAPGGAVTALWMLSDGSVLVGTAAGVQRWNAVGGTWQTVQVPPGAVPARALAAGEGSSTVFLLGWRITLRSEDAGATWTRVEPPDQDTLTALVEAHGALLGVAGGDLWRTTDAGTTWTRVAGRVQTLARDTRATTVWAAGQAGLLRSDDDGQTWQAFGQPLPEADTDVHAVSVDGAAGRAVLSTHRGVYVSFDGAATWTSITDNVPGHLQAGPLLVEPGDPTTLYVGFSLTPYEEQWRRATEGGAPTLRLSTTELAGSAALLGVVAILAAASLRWLALHRVAEPAR